jgi:RimJ/RimL family protein N-acetyltransferase
MEQKKMTTAFITGKHIYLRDVRLSDANENYYRWMNDSEVTKYTESRFYPVSKEALEEYVKEKQKNKDSIFLAIIFKENQQHIGNIKLGPINWIHRLADIGIIIGEKDYWGRGCAAEAIRLISNYAFSTLNLHKLTAGCYKGNAGSGKAFEKAGFTKEGMRKAHMFYDGGYQDIFQYGLINQGE